ncbi:MAG TPA: hypothetical protein VJW76_08795, partial [Verrucomicrobiae bacterium]|nr:hypothetical protein [Verrucomicrobiae bacterium]
MKTFRRFRGKRFICTASRSQVQGEPAIAVMIFETPAKTPAVHFETQVASASGPDQRLGKRFHQCNHTPPAFRRGGLG